MKTLTATSNLFLKDKIEKIKGLNLEPIMVKLLDKKEGEGWTIEQATVTAKWYKRFLILSLKYPDQSIVPNKQIDTFWHYHILDTMKYAEDCENTFGYFLHHFPYFGMRGETDAQNLQNAFKNTTLLMKDEFGESLVSLAELFFTDNKSAICDDSGGQCYGQGCKDVKCGPNSNYDRPTLKSILSN